MAVGWGGETGTGRRSETFGYEDTAVLPVKRTEATLLLSASDVSSTQASIEANNDLRAEQLVCYTNGWL